jgi:hypothetical protein
MLGDDLIRVATLARNRKSCTGVAATKGTSTLASRLTRPIGAVVSRSLRNGVARWRSSHDGSDEQMFGAK